jgi:hypothetical protein
MKRSYAPAEPPPQETAAVLPFTPLANLEHLLRVAGSVAQDANRTWADIWGDLKRCVTHTGAITPAAEAGFVPSCGWPEFLERFWLLKHYIDSIERICDKQH